MHISLVSTYQFGHGYSKEAESLCQAVAVMRLSHSWGSDAGQKRATANLKRLHEFNPLGILHALCLRIGCKYMPSWVRGALSPTVVHLIHQVLANRLKHYATNYGGFCDVIQSPG